MTSPVIQAFAESMRPPSRLPVVDWCRKHVQLPHSNKSPLWDIEGSPWLREPMAAAADNANREIVMVAPTGSGKTTFFEGVIPWIVAESPGNILYVEQTDESAGEWAESRLMPALRLCEPIRHLWPKDRHKARKTEIIFPHLSLWIGGAGISNLQAKSVRWVLLDEAWTYKPGRIQMARRRTHDGWNSRVCILSQGGTVGDDLSLALEQTDNAEFCYSCPDCGTVQPWKFSALKWEESRSDDGKRNWRQMAETVRLVCDCGHECRDRPDERRALASSGRYVPRNPNPVPRHRGYTYNAMAVWWVPWLDLIREFLNANDEKAKGNLEPLKLFTQQRMAQFWVEETTADRSALQGAGYRKSDYHEGQRIDGEVHRFATADKQRDHFWLVVRAWRADGSSRLLFEGKVLTFESIEQVANQYGVKPQFVFVDAQYDTGKVYSACGKHGWTALHGSQEAWFPWHVRGKKFRRFYSPINLAQSPDGKEVRYIFWSNEKIKDALIILRTGQGMAWELPDDLSEEYVRQIDSEMKKEVVSKADKSVVMRWVRIKRDNHLWDCECMQAACAMMMRILGDTTSEDEN